MKMTSILKGWLLDRVDAETGWSPEYRQMVRASIYTVPSGTELMSELGDIADDGNTPLEVASIAADYFGARSSVEP